MVCNKTRRGDGARQGRVSISSLLWHLTIVSVPNMLSCWFVFQTVKDPYLSAPFWKGTKQGEKFYVRTGRTKPVGWSSSLEAGGSTLEPGALTLCEQRGSGQSTPKSITRTQTMPVAESEKSLRGIHENYPTLVLDNRTPEILRLISHSSADA